MTDSPNTVDYAGFRAALAPTIKALYELVGAVEAARERHGGQEAATSKAMDEIAQEKAYMKRSSWELPVTDAHTFGDMTLRAATDYVKTYAAAIDAETTPVYGHLVVARSALEACTVSAWLNDPRILVEERVKRALCEHLYSALELKRLNVEADASERIERWQAVAEAFEWDFKVDRGKPVVAGVKRPSVAQAIDDLLDVGPSAVVGRTEWSYLSSVSHVTWYGLRQSIGEAQRRDAAGISRVAFGTTSASVRAQAICLLRCLRRTAEAKLVLAGWNDEQWQRASHEAEGHERALLNAAQAGRL